MKRWLWLVFLAMPFALGLQAQPYLITATNYAAGLFGVVADENGQPLSVGSQVQLIWDVAGDGMDDPSTQPGFWGLPTDDDALMGTAQIGITGGAPSAGTFVLPGTASTSGGWCYLRAFNAVTPGPGAYFSESLSELSIPTMANPTLYGIEFPAAMIRVLGSAPTLTANATPSNPPIIISPNGGVFQYTVVLQNHTTQPLGYDVWLDVILPAGSVYGPLLTRPGLNMPGQTTWMRLMTQNIPAGAPPGLYSYRVHAGNLQSLTIISEDAFPFEKQGAGSIDGLPTDFLGWETTGWENLTALSDPIPDVFFLAAPYPNPFNPSTQLRFGLPQASDVRVEVFNILGSRVITLVDRHLEAGYHHVVWDAKDIASGLYLVQMKAGGYVYTEKALLIK